MTARLRRRRTERECRVRLAEGLVLGICTLAWGLAMANHLSAEQLWPFGESLKTEVRAGPPVVAAHQRFSILEDGRELGTIETHYEPQEGGVALLRTVADARLVLLRSVPLHVRSQTTVQLGADGRPQSIFATLSVPEKPDLSLEIEGLRQGARLHIMLRHGETVLLREALPLAGLTPFSGSLLPFGDLRGLQEGERRPWRYFNPVTRRSEKGDLVVVGRSRISWGGARWPVWDVRVRFQGNVYLRPLARVDEGGRLLRLEGLGGYTIVREMVENPDAASSD